MQVGGPDYARNDHVAFREDLEALHAGGWRIVPLREIARALVEARLHDLRGCVGLSFDDGSDFDYHDLPHPSWGPQRGMANILADFRARHGSDAQPSLHATSFSIVSPEARLLLDRTCMIGCRWWNHDWWPRAERDGLMAIESHSWDHNHESLEHTASSAPRGTFAIAREVDADHEIATASRVLRQLRGRDGAVLFAYPYGEVSDFLAHDYLPRFGDRHGVFAAFGTGGEPVTGSTSRWKMPRHVFGHHWQAPGELLALLGKPARGARVAVSRAEPRPRTWRDCLRTWEVNDARVVAGDLFRRCFGHEIPGYPRHFVLVYSPPPESPVREPSVVAYVHQTPQGEFHLCGGMCVDEHAYRRFPKWLFAQVREQGGLATIVTRDSMLMLGASLASFGHVGEPRARAADLRTGFVDTGVEHLMVMWLKELPDADKRRLIAAAEALAPF